MSPSERVTMLASPLSTWLGRVFEVALLVKVDPRMLRLPGICEVPLSGAKITAAAVSEGSVGPNKVSVLADEICMLGTKSVPAAFSLLHSQVEFARFMSQEMDPR